MPTPQHIIRSIQSHTADIFESLVSLRRDLHQHPELSGFESRTAEIIAHQLNRLNLEVRTDVGGYGIVADLITDPAAPMVALRVDMDALPITEINLVPYRSKVPGVMHACGHDVHSTIGIGTAAVLSGLTTQLPGNIRFIFQPEEEEITGALRMIHQGALSHPAPQAIFGVHVAPIPSGQIAWTDGLFLAGFDHMLVELFPQVGFARSGKSLHSLAHHCCQAILSLNEWHLPKDWETMQVFWQTMQAGPKNLRQFIVYDASVDTDDPSESNGQLGIGIKAANHHLRRAAMGQVRATLNPICQRNHLDYHILPMGSMIDMRNDAALVNATLPALKTALSPENVIKLNAAFPFNCEDFAYYTKYIPGAMVWLGGSNPAEGKFAMLHTPDFDVDENCIKTGTIAMATLLFNTLSK